MQLLCPQIVCCLNCFLQQRLCKWHKAINALDRMSTLTTKDVLDANVRGFDRAVIMPVACDLLLSLIQQLRGLSLPARSLVCKMVWFDVDLCDIQVIGLLTAAVIKHMEGTPSMYPSQVVVVVVVVVVVMCMCVCLCVFRCMDMFA